MRTNLAYKPQPEVPAFTHEGARTIAVGPEQELRRTVMACLLWEDSFYESGASVADRIAALVPQCRTEWVAACAYHARTAMKLRHVPLLLCREMLRHDKHRPVVGELLADCIQRPDEMAEFMAIYWKDGKKMLPWQVKKAFGKAFHKFSEYQLAKWRQPGAQVRLRDAMFLAHPKPEGAAQESLFKRVADDELETPGTWENRLSAGEPPLVVFTDLMENNKLGGLAFLRNLRNMREAGVSQALVEAYSQVVDLSMVLPFRFVSAARTNKEWEPMIEAMMFRCLEVQPKLAGKTAVVVDNSGSMRGPKVSAKSELQLIDAAASMAVLMRELCDETVVIGFGTSADVIPARRGFALIDAIKAGPGGGTNTDTALALAEKQGYDRIIVITDEQSHQHVRQPLTSKGYFINVGFYQNGIAYGKWTTITGWSDSVIDYIRAAEAGVE